jgi:hypothetical protein
MDYFIKYYHMYSIPVQNLISFPKVREQFQEFYFPRSYRNPCEKHMSC